MCNLCTKYKRSGKLSEAAQAEALKEIGRAMCRTQRQGLAEAHLQGLIDEVLGLKSMDDPLEFGVTEAESEDESS